MEGVCHQDDAVLEEWVEKNGSFNISGGTCGSFLQAIRKLKMSRRASTGEEIDICMLTRLTPLSTCRPNHPIIATYLATFLFPVARHNDENKATRDFPLTTQDNHQMPVPISCSCCCYLGESAD